MKRNDYLEKIGLKRNEYGTKALGNKHPIKYFSQRRRYGFDERETWNIDVMFAEWLYSHLMMYYEVSNTNVDFHKIEIDGQVRTVGEIIEEIINLLKDFLLKNHETEEDDTVHEKLKRAIILWSEIFPYIWW